jgi:predicted DNA-binding transcriptional regulator YafY
MPKSKDFYHRIEIIDECLRQRSRKWDIKALLNSVNAKLDEPISKRTLQYTLDYLINEKGAPIGKKKDGAVVYYFYTEANYSIKNLPLSYEEIVLLKDAVEVIKQVGSNAIANDALNVIGRLENTIAQNPLSNRTIIQFERHTTSSGLEHMDDLFTAIKEKIVLKITYQPFGKEAYEQLVHPYLLKEYRNRWFLLARDDKHDTLCNLALDRIRAVKPARADFKENDIFNPTTYFDHLIGVTFPVGEQISDIIIKVNPSQVPYIRTKPIHFNQEIEEAEDGCILVKLRLFNNYEMRSVLLGYGADIEVLQPSKLREQMREIFGAAFVNYDQPVQIGCTTGEDI